MAQVPLNILLIPPSLYNPLTTSIGPEYLGGPVAACCTYDRINPIRNSLLVKRMDLVLYIILKDSKPNVVPVICTLFSLQGP